MSCLTPALGPRNWRKTTQSLSCATHLLNLTIRADGELLVRKSPGANTGESSSPTTTFSLPDQNMGRENPQLSLPQPELATGEPLGAADQSVTQTIMLPLGENQGAKELQVEG
jgi:hypothetical protein